MYTKLAPWNWSRRSLAAGALVAAASLTSVWAADPGGDHASRWSQHRQEWVRTRLQRDANRLEITASQQAAWREYASARSALAERSVSKPGRDADAATIAKYRADRAAEGARKLAVLADATAKLQTTLSPEQRETLNQMAHRGHHRMGVPTWRHGQEGLRGEGQKNAMEPSQSEEAPAA